MKSTTKALTFSAAILVLSSLSLPATGGLAESASAETLTTSSVNPRPATLAGVPRTPAPQAPDLREFTPPAPVTPPDLGRGGYSVVIVPVISHPVADAFISSGFGHRECADGPCTSWHEGIDYASGLGAPVHPIANGTVVFAGDDGNFGNKVVIEHDINGERFTTVYAHLDFITAWPGQAIRRTEQLGGVGNTGRSYGVHLHFEIRPDGGAAVDPVSWLANHDTRPFPG